VAELRGAIKVVTNDGAVLDFASVETFTPRQEYPAGEEAAGGLASLCLDDATGYVFATHLFQDERGVFRNNIVRFATAPHVFATKPNGRVEFRSMFAPYPSGLSHQIGGCVVRDGALYVGVGDGLNVAASQDTTKLAGKILRMDLDGRPLPSNPLIGDPENLPAAFIWAYGVRNPFGLAFANERLFSIENGPDVDNLREIGRGKNYRWDGTNWSMGLNARVTFWPPFGPVHLAWLAAGARVIPDASLGRFLIAVSGAYPRGTGSAPNPPGVLSLPYDSRNDAFPERAKYLVRFRGSYEQRVSGIAATPDAIYFTSMLPDADGRAHVLRLTHDKSPPAPVVQRAGDALGLMTDKGCFACHQIDGVGGTQAPSLDKTSLLLRLRVQLETPQYAQQLRDMDELDEAPFSDYRDARERVRTTTGRDKMRTWVKYHVMEPRFDRTDTAMPNLGLSEQEGEMIAAFLLGGGGSEPSWRETVVSKLRYPVIALALGFTSGAIFVLLVVFGCRQQRRAR
jgi:hypothetical protein